MITFRDRGGFHNTEKFFNHVSVYNYLYIFEKYGVEGVNALASVTPIDTGKTSNSWGYEIHRYYGGTTIAWTNSNIVDGVSIAVILQYGHGTQYGAYVEGRDYINPAIKPIFDKIANELWKEVIKQ